MALVSVEGFAQQKDFGLMFNTYEQNKKEVATGYLYSGILPGGGLFYAQQNPTGFLYMGGEIALGILAFSNDAKGDRSLNILGIVGLFVVKVMEYFSVADSIFEFNTALRLKIGFSASPLPGITPPPNPPPSWIK